MHAEELQNELQSGRAPVLLQVLTPEVFAAARIPGSRHACIYETAFLEQVRALGLDAGAPLVVYGAGGGSLDAETAAEALRGAGFGRVRVFAGGIAEWKAAGFALEGTGELPQAAVPEGVYRVDTAQSVIRWTGRNLFNHHSGTVRLGGGELEARAGRLLRASFTVEMATMACEDLGDPALNAMLLAHLRTADFFDVAHHPTASFVADSAEPIPGCTDGTASHLLRGTFTLRGVSQPLEFRALIATKDEGRHLTGQAVLDLDRTAYGSRYGSGRFFRFLGQHVVNDLVHLHVKIHAERV